MYITSRPSLLTGFANPENIIITDGTTVYYSHASSIILFINLVPLFIAADNTSVQHCMLLKLDWADPDIKA